MPHRRTARLRLRQPHSCDEPSRREDAWRPAETASSRRAARFPEADTARPVRATYARGAVELPGLWTPDQRRAGSEGRRGGRPQAVGNLADELLSLMPAPRPARFPQFHNASSLMTLYGRSIEDMS